jgi:hypothetical protein
MNSTNPFPLQLHLVKSVEPKTPLQEEMYDEVDDLRNQEEHDAVRRMRQNHKRYVKHVSESMEEHAKQLLQEIANEEKKFGNKIHSEEKNEERMGIKNHDEAHEQDHGIARHSKKLLNTVETHKKKEKNNRKREMNQWYKEKEKHAVEGMRDNQEKDLDQIVQLTSKLENKTQHPLQRSFNYKKIPKNKFDRSSSLYVNGELFYRRPSSTFRSE